MDVKPPFASRTHNDFPNPPASSAVVLTTVWRAWLLLAILAASSVAQAQPATLTAARDDNGITIEWTGPAGAFTVIVAREDPLAGRIVERILPVHLQANAKLVLPGTHPGAVEVRVTEGGEVARATPAVDLPDPALGAKPPLASAPIVSGSVGGASRVPFEAHRVSNDRADETTARLLVAGGAVVAAWMHVERGGPAGPPVCWIRVASSLDGGRHFGRPLTVAGPLETAESNWPCHGIHHWSATSLAGGFVLLGHDARRDAEGARLYLIDPISSTIAWRGPMGLAFDGAFALAPANDGGFFVAGHQASGPAQAPEGVSIWHGFVAGDVRWVASQPSGWVYEMHAGATAGTVAFAWSQRDALGYSISRDGGDTFAGGAFDDYRNSQLNLDGFAVSQGVLHAAVANHVTGQAHYLRDAPHGVDVKEVCGRPGSLLDDCQRGQYLKLAAAGPRVWLLFEGFLSDEAPGQSGPANAFYLAESTNGGSTYGTPLRLADGPGDRLSSPYHMTISPDGRPLLFAHAFLAGSAGEEAADAVVPLFDPLGAVVIENGVRAPTLFANSERPSLMTAWNASRDAARVRIPIVIENWAASSITNLQLTTGDGQVVDTIPPRLSLAPGQSLAATAIVASAADELTLMANGAGQSFTAVVSLPPRSVPLLDPTPDASPSASRGEPRESIPGLTVVPALLAIALLGLRRRP